MAKTTFFFKTLKTLARFSPRRDVYVYMYICIYVYMYICIYVYMYVCMYVYVYMYMYIYICIHN